MTQQAQWDLTPTAMPSARMAAGDLCIEDVLEFVASEVAASLPAARDVRLVLRGRRGGFMWGPAGRHGAGPPTQPDTRAGVVVETFEIGSVARREGVVACPIIARRRNIGAAVITASDAGEISESEVVSAERTLDKHGMMLDIALAFVEARDRATNLERAMENRAAIEQAKGVLMARHRVSADDAFAMLRDRSQRSNQKVSVVAALLLAETADRAPLGRIRALTPPQV